MKKIPTAALLILFPIAAIAMPSVGASVGTKPGEVKAALAASGCTVTKFESEGGTVEAVCTDAKNASWEVAVDPKTGTVTHIKEAD